LTEYEIIISFPMAFGKLPGASSMKKELFTFRRAFLFLLTVVLSGCGSARYEADYNGFNSAYADSSNRQMLLNLARLDQHDPTYFLQFGQISVQYNLTGSFNASASNTVPQSTFRVPIVTEMGGIAGGMSTTPSFTFIPVADDKVAQELLQPVPANVLYTLFQQGWPVDQLLRLMVERFEIQLPGQTKVTTYVNTPDRGNVASYVVFLKICAIAREFQKDGYLKLLGNEEFVPLAANWTSPTAPTAKDLLDAQDKHLVYQQNSDGKWGLGSRQLVPRFVLEEGGESTFERLRKTSAGEGQSLANMRALLAQGFSVEGNYKEKDNTGPRMVLRSFLNILAAAAQEQTSFNALVEKTALISHVPPLEARPILRLRWDGKHGALMSPLIALDYHGQTYQVTDPVSHQIDEAASWNRDVFRLMTELASQVSVDISKFPLPTSLQVLPSP
jgi:hypothetical protein